MMLPLLAHLLLGQASFGQLRYDAKPTDAMLVSLVETLNKLDRPDAAAVVKDPESKFVLAEDGAGPGNREVGWRIETKSSGSFFFCAIRPNDKVDHVDLTNFVRPASEEHHTSATLEIRARQLAAKFVDDVELVPTQRDDQTPSGGAQFDYYIQGSHDWTDEFVSIFPHQDTGQVLKAFLPLKPENGYMGERVLPIEQLKSIALALYADAHPFPQGEILSAGVGHGIPGGYNVYDRDTEPPPTRGLAGRLYSPEANARYREMWQRGFDSGWQKKIEIPLYGLSVGPAGPRGAKFYVTLDARDGTFMREGMVKAGGLGGGSDLPILPDLPTTVQFVEVKGSLAELNMTSFTPPGRPVAVAAGRRVFAARFEPGQGTLWLRRSDKESYRAFRPDATLLAAMRKEKAPRPFGKRAGR